LYGAVEHWPSGALVSVGDVWNWVSQFYWS